MTRPAHVPEWVWVTDDGEPYWEDENQPDSDQFSGTAAEWLAVLADAGIHPPEVTP